MQYVQSEHKEILLQHEVLKYFYNLSAATGCSSSGVSLLGDIGNHLMWTWAARSRWPCSSMGWAR